MWVRINELYHQPLFEKKLIDPNYIQQGYIGDCYLITSFSLIAREKYLVKNLFETKIHDKILSKVKNSINLKPGAVVIKFRTLRGTIPILIDTRIPVRKNSKTPIFSHPKTGKSPWFLLVEKA